MNLVLDSARLRLRPLTEADLDLTVEIYTDPAVMKYAGGARTRAQVVAKHPQLVRRCAGGCVGVWSVADRTSGEGLGVGILLPLPVEAEQIDYDLVVGDELPDAEIEVGYLLKPSAWGRGIATETCRRLLRFAFEDSPLDQVIAVTAPENTASQNVLLKCGMTAEPSRRAYGTDGPGFHITRAEWLAGRD